MDMWPLPCVLGWEEGHISWSRYAAWHGPQQCTHLVEGCAGLDVAAAFAPAAPTEGQLAQTWCDSYASGRKWYWHDDTRILCVSSEERPAFTEKHFPPVPSSLVRHPATQDLETLGWQHNSEQHATGDQQNNTRCCGRAWGFFIDSRQHNAWTGLWFLQTRWRSPLRKRDWHF